MARQSVCTVLRAAQSFQLLRLMFLQLETKKRHNYQLFMLFVVSEHSLARDETRMDDHRGAVEEAVFDRRCRRGDPRNIAPRDRLDGAVVPSLAHDGVAVMKPHAQS